MTITDDGLDRALSQLPRDLPPGRDLWPGIAAEIGAAKLRRWLPLAAAAVLLVAASSLITASLVRRSGDGAVATAAAPAGPRNGSQPAAGAAVAQPAGPRNGSQPAAGAAVAQPAAFGPGHALSPEYAAARAQLAAMLTARIDDLPSSARQKLEDNLAQLRRATDEINAALALQPGDPLLEELLLNTYQEELAVLASVNDLTTANGPAAAAADKGIKL